MCEVTDHQIGKVLIRRVANTSVLYKRMKSVKAGSKFTVNMSGYSDRVYAGVNMSVCVCAHTWRSYLAGVVYSELQPCLQTVSVNKLGGDLSLGAMSQLH